MYAECGLSGRFALTKHSNCTAQYCHVDVYPSDGAAHGHIRADCHCALLPIGWTELSGQVLDIPELTFVNRRGQHYIAISHVWVHNLMGNAAMVMQTCAVEHIRTIANLLGLRYVWIDTCCIPAEEAARRQEIRLMSDIYANSAITLIYDIDMLRLGEISMDEVLLRLTVSDWNSRVWTLQEGILGSNVAIVLEKAVIPVRLLSRILTHKRPHPLVWKVINICAAISTKRHFELHTVCNMLAQRHTSKKRDTWLGVAALLNMDLTDCRTLAEAAERAATHSVTSLNKGVLVGWHQRLTTLPVGAGSRWTRARRTPLQLT